jgi:lysozyme family protein
MAFQLTPALRLEYERLFNTCDIRPAKLASVEDLITKIDNNRARYERAGGALNVPWFFVGAVHCLESSLNFTKHLHNGDPLARRTVQVPKGRPLVWNPPTDWESSADDALRLRKLHTVTDWSIPGILFQLEGYNGFGYRRFHPEVLSPYLWSFSNHYSSGKFVADGTFDPDAVSKQCGCAVLLRRMSETGLITFDSLGNPVTSTAGASGTPAAPTFDPLVTFSNTVESEAARKLQQALNSLPGIFLLVDGVPGTRTSDAFKKATGHFLKGDPRAGTGAVAG